MLKVYTWTGSGGPWLQGYEDESWPANGSRQVRYVVAATSWQKAVAAVKYATVSGAKMYGGTIEKSGSTSNMNGALEALAQPGIAFWCQLDRYRGNWRPVDKDEEPA